VYCRSIARKIAFTRKSFDGHSLLTPTSATTAALSPYVWKDVLHHQEQKQNVAANHAIAAAHWN